MIRYLVLVIVVFFVGCTERLKTDITSIGESFPQGVSAVSWDGKNLIVAKNGLIAFLDNIDTAVAGSIYRYEGHYFFGNYPITITSKESPPYITGIAWQRTVGNTGYLWVADVANKKILKITPHGKTLRKISIPEVYPEDMTFDGDCLWVADSKRVKLFRLSTEDGSAVAEYLSPVPTPTAITWDGKYIVVAGLKNFKEPSNSSQNVRIVKLDPETGKVVEEVAPSRYISYPSAMVWINGKLWISDRNSGYIVKISDWGSPPEDEKNYKLATAVPTVKKIEVKEEKIEIDKIEKYIEEAKKAAEEAKKSAEEAKCAAEAAKKAFELLQKK